MTAGSKPSDYGGPAFLGPLGRRWPRLVCLRHGHDPIWRIDDLRLLGLTLMPDDRHFIGLSAEFLGRTQVCTRCRKELDHVGTSAR